MIAKNINVMIQGEKTHFKYIKTDKGKYQGYKSIYTDPGNVIIAFKFTRVHVNSK